MAGLNDAFKTQKGGGDYDRHKIEHPQQYDRYGDPIDREYSQLNDTNREFQYGHNN